MDYVEAKCKHHGLSFSFDYNEPFMFYIYMELYANSTFGMGDKRINVSHSERYNLRILKSILALNLVYGVVAMIRFVVYILLYY